MDFIVYMCKKNCRNQSHYHCPFCDKNFIRKINANKHFIKCFDTHGKKEKKTNLHSAPSYNQHTSKFKKESIKCSICQKTIFQWNFSKHMKTHVQQGTQEKRLFLFAFAIDTYNGIYLVDSGIPGLNCSPPHVQKYINYEGFHTSM